MIYFLFTYGTDNFLFIWFKSDHFLLTFIFSPQKGQYSIIKHILSHSILLLFLALYIKVDHNLGDLFSSPTHPKLSISSSIIFFINLQQVSKSIISPQYQVLN